LGVLKEPGFPGFFHGPKEGCGHEVISSSIHPIAFLAFVYRAHPKTHRLQKLADVVEEPAETCLRFAGHNWTTFSLMKSTLAQSQRALNDYAHHPLRSHPSFHPEELVTDDHLHLDHPASLRSSHRAAL
jgi:hypothetical protein